MAREVATPVVDETPGGKKHGVLSFFRELPVLVALALVIALIIKAFLVQAFFIPSASMKPTLDLGDRVLVNKLTYRFHPPRRGDVVVFKDPYPSRCAAPAGGAQEVPPPPECNRSIPERAFGWFAELFGLPTEGTKDYIKRIVGLPGETIQLQDGDVYVCKCPEPAADPKNLVKLESTDDKGPQKDNYTMPPYEIGADEYYVLGDNRGNSSDSRIFKAIDRDKIIGKAFVLLWPPNRFSGL